MCELLPVVVVVVVVAVVVVVVVVVRCSSDWHELQCASGPGACRCTHAHTAGTALAPTDAGHVRSPQPTPSARAPS